MIRIQKGYIDIVTPLIRAFGGKVDDSGFPSAVLLVSDSGASNCTFTVINGMNAGASNTGLTMTIVLPLIEEATETMCCFVPVVRFSAWLGSVTEDVTIEQKPNAVVIRDGGNRTRIPTLAGELPANKLVGQLVAEMRPIQMAALLRESKYSVSENDGRLHAEVIDIVLTPPRTIIIQGTNSFRGVHILYDDVDVKDDFEFIAPAFSLTVIERCLAAAMKLEGEEAGNSIKLYRLPVANQLTDGSLRVSYENGDGFAIYLDINGITMNYPDLAPFMAPRPDSVSITLDKTLLRRTIGRIIADGQKAMERHILLRGSNGAFYITSVTPDGVQTELEITEFASRGELGDFRIKINLPYLQQVLAVIPGDSVTLTQYLNEGNQTPLSISTEECIGTHVIQRVVL